MIMMMMMMMMMMTMIIMMMMIFLLYDRFAVSFISWGVSFSAPFLGGNIYVNVVLTAVAALPAYPISAVLALR